jgi:PAS domain S-box-containing protein
MPHTPPAGAVSGDVAPPTAPGLPSTGWPLHRYLLAMTLAVLLPVLAFAGVLLWYDVTRQYDIHRRGMLATVQAFSLAVDREWATVQAILQTLAASELLAAGDLRAFYDLCTKVVERLSGARIILFAPSGQQLLNTLLPFGAELPNPFVQSESSPPARAGEVPLASAETVRRAFQTGQPVYSDLFIALVSLRHTVSLDMPVWRDGRIVYVLTMAIFPESFTRLLQEQNFPADMLATILDQRGMIIARSQKPEQFVGQPAHPTRLAALATSDTGWEHSRAVEQAPVYSAWTRSAVTGWTTVISVTEASIISPIQQSLVLWAGGGLLALGLALGLALLVARRITAPLAALTRSADLVQRGQLFAMPPVAVQEVQHLSAALMVTAETIRQQAAERERRLLAEAEVAERAQREAAQRFLAEASTLLSSSLDPTTQLEHLARLLVPTLADWCSIDLLQDDGRIHRVVVVHADPTKAALAEQLRQQYSLLAADATHTLVRVLRTGQSWFDPAASAERLRAEARDTAHWELIQALGFTAEIVVPLLARGWALGTITCVLGEGAHRYSEADLALAEDLARRAALALDNARLYQEAQATQDALQQANATLRAQGEQLRVITDSIPGCIAHVDRAERYRFVNAAYERRFGVPRTQILGRTIRDLRAPIYTHLQPYLARALAGEPMTFENTYESAADAPALQVSYVPDWQPDGQVAGLYVLISDITVQKQVQAELASTRRSRRVRPNCARSIRMPRSASARRA